MRYFVKFSYNGTRYHGWQSQPNAVTVQQTMEQAFSVILGQPVALTGAGRTDSGVHASEMFAHFDTEALTETEKTVQRLNALLPKDIAIAGIFPVHDGAHARFDALKRTYQYHIYRVKDVFNCDLGWKYTLPLDVYKMNAAAAILFEYKDFECFSKVHTDVNTFNCDIVEAKWEMKGSELVFTIAADRFLRNMVRAIVGTLVNVGQGKLTLEGFRQVIESKNRGKAGFSVPAQGLFLVKVDYEYLGEAGIGICNKE